MQTPIIINNLMLTCRKVEEFSQKPKSGLSVSQHSFTTQNLSAMFRKPISSPRAHQGQQNFENSSTHSGYRPSRDADIRHTLGVQTGINPKRTNNGKNNGHIQDAPKASPADRIPLKNKELPHKWLTQTLGNPKTFRNQIAYPTNSRNFIENKEPICNKILNKLTEKQKLLQELKKIAQFQLPTRAKKQPKDLKIRPHSPSSELNLLQAFKTHKNLKSKKSQDQNTIMASFYSKNTIPSKMNPEDKLSSNQIYFTPKTSKQGQDSSIRKHAFYTPSHQHPYEQGNQLHGKTVSVTQISRDRPATHLSNKYHEIYRKSTNGSSNYEGTNQHIIAKESIKKKSCLSDFKILKKLGEGKFGTVFAALQKQAGALFALKKISKSVIKSHLMIDQLIVEIKIQSFCNHKNIVRLYDCFDDCDNLYLVLEYMPDGTLFEYLKNKKVLSEIEAAEKVKEVAQAVKYLHDKGIVHRDIKPQNIVMTNETAKLCDFGWAAICNDRRRTYCGTFDYAAPEILEGNEYDMSVDLWCLGVLAYELLVGKAPFYHISRKETMKKIMSVESSSLVFPDSLSEKAVSFICSLLRKRPEQRMNVDAILAHPFLTQIKTQ